MSAHEPQAGFTQDEDDQIQNLHSFHRLTFYTIQEQHFPDRSVKDIERRFYEVRDARAHLGPRAQNQELQQQREPQSAALPSVAERLLDIEGITDGYLVEGSATLIARVHPRWSDILVVNIAYLRYLLGSNVNLFPEATNATHTFRTVSLASQNCLGPPGSAQRPVMNSRMSQALALSLFGAACPRTCLQCEEGSNPVFLECRRQAGYAGGACNECVLHERGQMCSLGNERSSLKCDFCFNYQGRCDGKRPCNRCIKRKRPCFDVTQESRNKIPEREYRALDPGLSRRACDRCSGLNKAKGCDKIPSGCSICRDAGQECRYTLAAKDRTGREKKLKRKSAQEGNFQQGSARHLGSQALQQQQADDEIFYRHSPPAPGNQQQAKRPRSMNVGSEGTGVGSTSRINPVAQAPPRPGDPVTSAGASASRPQQHQPQLGSLLPGDDVSSSSSILAMYAPAPSRGPPTPTPPLHQRRPRRAPPTPTPPLNQPQQPTSLLTREGIGTAPRPQSRGPRFESTLALYAPAPHRGPPTPTPPLHQRRPGRGPPTPPPLSSQAQESPSRPVSGVAPHETRVSMVELGRALPAASGPESHVMGDNRRGGSGRENERVGGRGHGRGRGRA